MNSSSLHPPIHTHGTNTPLFYFYTKFFYVCQSAKRHGQWSTTTTVLWSQRQVHNFFGTQFICHSIFILSSRSLDYDWTFVDTKLWPGDDQSVLPPSSEQCLRLVLHTDSENTGSFCKTGHPPVSSETFDQETLTSKWWNDCRHTMTQNTDLNSGVSKSEGSRWTRLS